MIRSLGLIVVIALGLAGCAQVQQVGKAISVATTTIANPVSETDIYRAKNVYAATLALAVEYRRFCWSKPYAALLADPVAAPLCRERRAVVRGIQAHQPKVAAAIRSAENFVRTNPTINAVSVISAMWSAVNDFKAAVPVVR